MDPIAWWRPATATVICLLTIAMAMPSAHARQTPSAKDFSAVIDMLRSFAVPAGLALVEPMRG